MTCHYLCPDTIYQKETLTIVQVVVRDNNVDQALKALKKKMQREGASCDSGFEEMNVNPTQADAAQL